MFLGTRAVSPVLIRVRTTATATTPTTFDAARDRVVIGIRLCCGRPPIARIRLRGNRVPASPTGAATGAPFVGIVEPGAARLLLRRRRLRTTPPATPQLRARGVRCGVGRGDSGGLGQGGARCGQPVGRSRGPRIGFARTDSRWCGRGFTATANARLGVPSRTDRFRLCRCHAAGLPNCSRRERLCAGVARGVGTAVAGVSGRFLSPLPGRAVSPGGRTPVGAGWIRGLRRAGEGRGVLCGRIVAVRAGRGATSAVRELRVHIRGLGAGGHGLAGAGRGLALAVCVLTFAVCVLALAVCVLTFAVCVLTLAVCGLTFAVCVLAVYDLTGRSLARRCVRSGWVGCVCGAPRGGALRRIGFGGRAVRVGAGGGAVVPAAAGGVRVGGVSAEEVVARLGGAWGGGAGSAARGFGVAGLQLAAEAFYRVQLGGGPRRGAPGPFGIPRGHGQKSAAVSSAVTSAPMPSFSLIFFSISSRTSVFSSRNLRAFSLPWPSWSPS